MTENTNSPDDALREMEAKDPAAYGFHVAEAARCVHNAAKAATGRPEDDPLLGGVMVGVFGMMLARTALMAGVPREHLFALLAAALESEREHLARTGAAPEAGGLRVH